MTTFAARLKRLRQLRGLSVEDLAARAGLARGEVYKLEAGRRPDPRASTVRALAGVLGASCDALIGPE